ncbi:MAG: Nitric oxide -responding transcriptional regulator Dnr (Crp/Fnr family) [uncultured Sulfurovum sp.]|uniref:Nitric oxide -responding transcriptional regulator Dnr (Crp/Fnr family) n=1 Tax=uncultured Sulfurovum sp. TaxID=269237 RepID=A0A6S6SVC0_9BACT|nr:MAG: Nitric oxide -responding transcriptional regulator Dnr (Crp/Fnr family) [uncultured Sulfurovum sp.]
MTKYFKTLLLLAFLPLTLLFANTQLDFSSLVDEFMDESNGLKKTINLSGKQRMLTQRMTKLVLQLDLNIQQEVTKVKLNESASLYDVTLKMFKEGDSDLGIKKPTNKAILEKINLVETEWAIFYKAIKSIEADKLDEKSLNYIIKNNEKLLKLSNDLVKAYEASNTSTNYLEKARLSVVNIAGRQRMLTQKMTKEKLLVLRGDKAYRGKLSQTIDLFDTTLAKLIKGDENQDMPKPSNEKIIKQLKSVLKLWSELKPLYLKEKNTDTEWASIIHQNPILLKKMNTMVLLAEKELEY